MVENSISQDLGCYLITTDGKDSKTHEENTRNDPCRLHVRYGAGLRTARFG